MNMNVNDRLSRLLRAPADAGGGSADPAAAAAATPADPAPPPSQAPAAPDHSWLPDDFVKDGAPDFTSFRAAYDELAAERARRAEAEANIPAEASGYEIAVPADLALGIEGLPANFTFALDETPETQPIFDDLRATLHKHRLPKEAAGELLGILAKYEGTRTAAAYREAQAEWQALGPQADSRAATVERALQTRLSPDLAAALKAAVTTANGVRALEALLTPSAVPATAATPQTPDFSGMTPRQKLDYANQQQAQRRA